MTRLVRRPARLIPKDLAGRIQNIEEEGIKAAVKESNATINRELEVLGRMLRLAADNNKLHRVPGAAQAQGKRPAGRVLRAGAHHPVPVPACHRHGQTPFRDARGGAGRAAHGVSESLGACTDAGCPGMLGHDFRRTAARNLERAGFSRSVAIKSTGHRTEAVYRRYTITSDSDMRAAARRLGTFLGTPA